MRAHPLQIPWFLAIALTGCGDGDAGAHSGSGRVQIFVEPEDSIPHGLEPGSGDENIQDGWTVTYDKFLLAIGNFRASQSAHPERRLTHPKIHVVDLKNVPGGGLVLAEFTDVEATRWDRFGFDLANAAAGVEKAEGVSESDYALMVNGGFSLYVSGEIAQREGQSCLPTHPLECHAAPKVRFRWGLRAPTSFDDCAPEEGDAGFSVPSGGTAQIKPTIHGDHWFFSNLTTGAEITKRHAQWIANADLDRNGESTLDELRSTRASDLFPQDRYNLSGTLIPIHTGYDYLEAQARSLGDFQGDGECPTRRVLP